MGRGALRSAFMGDSRRWRNLGVASGALAAAMFAGFDLFQWAVAYGSDHFHNDFTFYYAAARIGVTHGWQSIYDLNLQQSELDAIGSRIRIAELARYISPPPVAWLALPFTLLPYPVAYLSWSALLRKHRPFLSGLALGVIVLKPQLGFLLPIALLAGGRLRAFAGAVLAIGVLLVASGVNVGPDGMAAYAERLSFAANVPVNQQLTLALVMGGLAAARLVQGAIAIWALALAYRLRKQSVE